MKNNLLYTASILFLFFFACKKEKSNPYPEWTTYNTQNSGLVSDAVTAIAIDSLGNKWFGTITDGISKFDGTHWTTYSTAAGYYINSVYSITVDKKNNIWVVADPGLLKYDGINWTIISTSYIGPIVFDAQGNLWDGASMFNGTNWITYTTSNSGLSNNKVYANAVDAQGDKWFGTWGGGISKFDGINWTTYTTTNSGLINDSINVIAIDEQGNKWFGTWQGVSKFDGTKWTSYTKANSGLANNLIWMIGCDKQNNLWFGFEYEGGISKFDGTNWTNFNTSNSGLSNNYVQSMVIDAQGNKWFATGGGGVSVLKN